MVRPGVWSMWPWLARSEVGDASRQPAADTDRGWGKHENRGTWSDGLLHVVELRSYGGGVAEGGTWGAKDGRKQRWGDVVDWFRVRRAVRVPAHEESVRTRIRAREG